MFDPTQLSATTKRRTLLSVLGGGLAVLFGAAPTAHARASFDASFQILNNLQDSNDNVVELWVDMLNESDQVIDPIFTAWSSGRRTQHPWVIKNNPGELRPGEGAVYHIAAPNHEPAVSLQAGWQSQLIVYDRGTEQRAFYRFRVSPDSGISKAVAP